MIFISIFVWFFELIPNHKISKIILSESKITSQLVKIRTTISEIFYFDKPIKESEKKIEKLIRILSHKLGKIPQNIIDQINETADIVDIVSQRVDLQKEGKTILDYVLFILKKTPSFSVAPDKGYFTALVVAKEVIL